MRAILSSAIIAAALAATPALAQGYSGLFAEDPAAPAPAANSTAQPQTEPPGYNGLISGATPVPGTSTPQPVTNSKQIINRAAEDAMAKENTFQPQQQDWSGWENTTHAAGQTTPMEESLVQLIAHYRKLVDNPNLTPDKKKENAELVYKQLSRYLTVTQQQLGTPADLYKQAGAPDAYIKQQQQSLTRAIATLKKAIEDIKAYL